MFAQLPRLAACCRCSPPGARQSDAPLVTDQPNGSVPLNAKAKLEPDPALNNRSRAPVLDGPVLLLSRATGTRQG